MKTFLLSLTLFLGSLTLSTAQSSDMPNRGDQIDQQLQQLIESLDTLDLTALFEQFSIPFGDGENRPSDKTLSEIQEKMDGMVQLLDNVDIKGMESLMTEFMDNMQSMLGDLDLPSTPSTPGQEQESTPSEKSTEKKKEIKKI